MKINMKILKWVLLGLYIMIVIGLVGIAYLHGGTPEEQLVLIVMIVVTIISQILFIFGAGTANLCTPIRKRRLLIPVIIVAVMMTVLIGGITLALGELIFENPGNWFGYLFLTIVAISWLTWGIIFFIWGTTKQRYKTVRNLISSMFAGSLLTLIVTIPSHIIVSKRPGCLVGLGTSMGICSGVFVMFWAFGPGIILLFLREKRKVELLRNTNGQ